MFRPIFRYVGEVLAWEQPDDVADLTFGELHGPAETRLAQGVLLPYSRGLPRSFLPNSVRYVALTVVCVWPAVIDCFVWQSPAPGSPSSDAMAQSPRSTLDAGSPR